MTSLAWLKTPHGDIRSSIDDEFPRTCTLTLDSDNGYRQTLESSDFGNIDSSSGDWAIVIETIRGSKNVTVKMHRTVAKNAITPAERIAQFGPTMRRGVFDPILPITTPFMHNTGSYLTFESDKSCIVIARVLKINA